MSDGLERLVRVTALDLPGHKVLAQGRTAHIFLRADGCVVRQFRVAGDPVQEARVMNWARDHGVPTPRVNAVDATSMVLEHVRGPTMLIDLQRRPWRLARHAQTLAWMHR